jgi:Icc-related predicted phosphoesterase
MRLLVISDIHLEFGSFEFPADLPEFDAAVFAGDIHQPVTAAVEWLAQERDAGALRGKPVVYVPGNHEFYRHEMKSELAKGQAAADEAGIHMLNRRAVVIEGVQFIGAILWTDYRLLGTPKPSMITAGDEMNDHRLIRYREDSGHYARFMPWHAAAEHRIDRDYLREQLERRHGGPTVVVTHHAPHPGSVQRRHQGGSLSPAFVSDLGWLIEATKPELWIHGHDHGSHDYQVGQTRVFANQAGYPRDGLRENPGFRIDCIVEV